MGAVVRRILAGKKVQQQGFPHVAHSLFGLGKLALRQGDQPKALDYLRQAVDHGLTPGEVTAMNEDAELTPLRGNPELESLFAYAKKDAHAH